MASHKKTYFLAPSWDIPADAISLGNLIADPTEPHRRLNSITPFGPDMNPEPTPTPNDEPTTPPPPKIDSPIYPTTFTGYTTTLSTSKANSFSLTAQLSLIFGIGGDSSVSFATDNITSYHFRTLHSEWFTPSPAFIANSVAQPDVKGFLAMLSSRRPIYMVTGVRRATGITASSSSEKERSIGGGVNADATALGVPLNVGIGAESKRGKGNSVEWECEGPVVFAYQLVKLKRKKDEWVSEEYKKGAFMGVGEEKGDEVVEQDGGILEGLDEDEVDVRNDGWDDLEEEECVVVAPRG